MRTTLSLDDDAFDLARKYADSRSLGLGKAVSELVRRGVDAPLRTRIVNGFHVVDLPPESPQITSEHVRRLQDEFE